MEPTRSSLSRYSPTTSAAARPSPKSPTPPVAGSPRLVEADPKLPHRAELASQAAPARSGAARHGLRIDTSRAAWRPVVRATPTGLRTTLPIAAAPSFDAAPAARPAAPAARRQDSTGPLTASPADTPRPALGTRFGFALAAASSMMAGTPPESPTLRVERNPGEVPDSASGGAAATPSPTGSAGDSDRSTALLATSRSSTPPSFQPAPRSEAQDQGAAFARAVLRRMAGGAASLQEAAQAQLATVPQAFRQDGDFWAEAVTLDERLAAMLPGELLSVETLCGCAREGSLTESELAMWESSLQPEDVAKLRSLIQERQAWRVAADEAAES